MSIERDNILGRKAVARAVLKERLITLISWIFIAFFILLVVFFSTKGLRTLFLTSYKHFTLTKLDVQVDGLPHGVYGLVNVELLKESLGLHEETHNLFEIDLKEVKKKVESHLCIEAAEVSYNFPDTIKISFTEKLPVARLSQETLVDKNGYILPNGRTDLSLPQIVTKNDFKAGVQLTLDIVDPVEKDKNKEILDALKFINLNSILRLKYNLAEDYLEKVEFASLEIIKIKNIIRLEENSLTIILAAVPEVKLADNTRLTVDVDDMEIGIRRACIAILQNAQANKITRKIDARYNSTPTE